MKANFLTSVLLAMSGFLLLGRPLVAGDNPEPVARFATYNVSLYGSKVGDVSHRLIGKDDPQASAVAEIIQRVRPDVLLLNEFDYYAEGDAEGDAEETLLDRFRRNYLAVPQNVSQSPDGPAKPIEFEYAYLGPSNTGIHSGFDLDRNGRVNATLGSADYGGDCWGFGRYRGQYAMVLLSRFPIDQNSARTFRKLLWKDMPHAQLPDNLATTANNDWYSKEILAQFPLSSKSHWDVSVRIGNQTVHVLASHPTPPVFDGPEDRNGLRNQDEIRFWADYMGPAVESGYIRDDLGNPGGLGANCSFVVMGDLNSDPHDGQSQTGIGRLLAAPRILAVPVPQSDGGREQAALQGEANDSQKGNPSHDTLDANDRPGPGNLRVDYVLPSSNMSIIASGVYWPKSDEPAFRLVGTHPFPGSDHRLVWVDLKLENQALVKQSLPQDPTK
jgi:hypothetical protein